MEKRNKLWLNKKCIIMRYNKLKKISPQISIEKDGILTHYNQTELVTKITVSLERVY